jgi:hypothetical protein
MNKENIIPMEIIGTKIYVIRGKKIMLDKDLRWIVGSSPTMTRERMKSENAKKKNSFEIYNLRFGVKFHLVILIECEGSNGEFG